MSSDVGETARDGTPPSSGLALPAFTSMRNSSPGSDHAESSTSGSWRKSWASHGSDLRNGRSPTPDETAPKEAASSPRNVTSGSIPGPSRSRHSGGFLLDSKSRPSRLSNSLLSRKQKDPQDIKGKRKSEDGDLVVPKLRPTRRHQKQENSIGGSPLATEVRRDVSGAEHQIQGDSNMGGSSLRSSPVPPRALGDVESIRDPKILPPKPNPRPVGFDSDPAQIVNLALSLSEGRRRQASGMRVVSANINETRRVSTAYPTTLQGARPSRAYFNEYRQTSRNGSPVHDNFNSPDLGGAGGRTMDETIIAGDQSHEEDADTEMLDVSPATFARVQKAKDHLELLYNFRRLLSHLPPIHRPGASLSAEASRIYNPLQYSRNRKLRFREKKPIPSEEEGWHDIQQVRTWVDAVLANHRETRHRPDECVRLPDLTQQKLQNTEDEAGWDQPDSATSSRRASHIPVAKPRRPKSDWVTHPGDLLADAFWLEQGLNKMKIEDRDGNKIYPPHTNFSFSGWRNRTPVHAFPQQPTPPPEEDQFSQELPEEPQSAVPDLPNFTSAHTHSRKHTSRGRRRDKLRDSIIGLQNGESGSGSRRKRLRKELQMSSSSEESGDDTGSRGRTRTSPRRKVKPKTAKDQTPLDEHMKDTVDYNVEYDVQPKGSSPANNSKRPSIVDGARLAKFISRSSSKAGSKRRDSAHRTESQRQSLEEPRMGRSSLEGERPLRSSAEYDTTAPSSPTAAQFPSIAINLSPPHSRSPSPSKKPLQSRINPFRDRSQEKRQNGVEASDFAMPEHPNDSAFHFNGSIAGSDISPHGSREASPHTRGTSPLTKPDSHTSIEPVPRHEPHRSSTVSKMSTRSSGSHPEHSSKIKGIFKGGRIAELVGHEVSRVGDYIWKREPPGHVPRASQSTASLTSAHSNESEDGLKHANGNASETPPRQQSGRVVSGEITPEGKLSRTQSHSTPSSGEQPQYHMSNLPSFTSPFQRDREREEERGRGLLKPNSSPPQGENGDHISQLAATHRSASKSSRLDRLKPPQLVTTRPSSPSSSSKLEHRDSYGFGNALDLSRVTSASQSMNSALNQTFPVTGLAGLRTSVSGNDLVRDWDTSDREGDNKAAVTKRDIARARTLLASSCVKAREITRRSNAIELPRKFLLDTIAPSDPILRSGKPFKVSRKEEHVIAAKNLISSLTAQSHQSRSMLDRFTGKTTPALHQSLQGLDDLVDNTLTPRVRVAADQAGELSMKLSSTSALAVKELNDIINGAFRRRRRGPVRYLRRFGYLLLEWSVVGLLWAMWAIWLVFALTFGTVKGMYKMVRWSLNFDGLQVLLLAVLLLLSNTVFSEASVT